MRLPNPKPVSLPTTSDVLSKGLSSLLETIGPRLVLLAEREIFCGLWLAQWETGGDEDRIDIMRFRLLTPTGEIGLFVQFDISQSLEAIAL